VAAINQLANQPVASNPAKTAVAHVRLTAPREPAQSDQLATAAHSSKIAQQKLMVTATHAQPLVTAMQLVQTAMATVPSVAMAPRAQWPVAVKTRVAIGSHAPVAQAAMLATSARATLASHATTQMTVPVATAATAARHAHGKTVAPIARAQTVRAQTDLLVHGKTVALAPTVRLRIALHTVTATAVRHALGKTVAHAPTARRQIALHTVTATAVRHAHGKTAHRAPVAQTAHRAHGKTVDHALTVRHQIARHTVTTVVQIAHASVVQTTVAQLAATAANGKNVAQTAPTALSVTAAATTLSTRHATQTQTRRLSSKTRFLTNWQSPISQRSWFRAPLKKWVCTHA
jgi:hypothetical protein